MECYGHIATFSEVLQEKYIHVENCWTAVVYTMLNAIVPARCKLQDSLSASWLKSCLFMRTIFDMVHRLLTWSRSGIFPTWFTWSPSISPYWHLVVFECIWLYDIIWICNIICIHRSLLLKFKITSCILQLQNAAKPAGKAEAIHLFLDSDSWLHHRRLQAGALGQRVESKNSLTVAQRIHKECNDYTEHSSEYR